MQPNTFLNGVPELLVLGILRDREMYGYELVQAIRDRTGNDVDFAEGVDPPAAARAGTRWCADLAPPARQRPRPALLRGHADRPRTFRNAFTALGPAQSSHRRALGVPSHA